MNLDRQAAIAIRAHQIWEKSGHVHGQDVQHWRQAEREYDEVEARIAAVEQFAAETAPAKPTRKRATKVVESAAEIPAAPTPKTRAARKASPAAALS